MCVRSSGYQAIASFGDVASNDDTAWKSVGTSYHSQLVHISSPSVGHALWSVWYAAMSHAANPRKPAVLVFFSCVKRWLNDFKKT